jgi:hypothetical protein
MSSPPFGKILKSWIFSIEACIQMSRSEPESGGLVLRVNQKKWSVFKTDKQRTKNEMILKKMLFECMLLY